MHVARPPPTSRSGAPGRRPRRRERGAPGRVAQQVHQAPRPGRRVLVAEQHARAPVVQHPAERGEVAGQHRGAGAHRLDQHDAEALAAGVRRDVDVDRPQQRGLVLVADLPRNSQARGELGGQLGGPPRVAAPGDQDPQARHAGQHLRAAPRAAPAGPCAARRSARGTRWSGAPACPASPRLRRRRGEPVDEHAVGDDDRVTADVGGDGAPGVLGDRDPGGDLLQARPQQRVGGLHGPRAQVRGVEGRDDRALGRPQRQQTGSG